MEIPKWLVVERLDNWLADKASDFSRFGIPKHVRSRAERIQKGELIVVYVSSGVSCFADIRRATSSTLGTLGFTEGYDDIFPHCIFTESVLALDRNAWVPIHPLLGSLDLTKGKADWRQVLRNPLRQLSEADATTVGLAMEKAYSKGTKER